MTGILVADAGPGISDPDAALKRGSSGGGSTGLGLDIARRAAESTGGYLRIHRSVLGGAQVQMWFRTKYLPPPRRSYSSAAAAELRRAGPLRRPAARFATCPARARHARDLPARLASGIAHHQVTRSHAWPGVRPTVGQVPAVADVRQVRLKRL